MIDITHKPTTLRRAVAEAKVFCAAATCELIKNKKVPKGDVLEMSRAAGLLAIKNTPHLLPFCHPIPVEYSDISFTLEADGVRIRVEAECIFRTGIEVEAMVAASMAALNMYDMLKPVDGDVVLGEIRVLEKSGGKGDFGKPGRPATAAVILCGDAYIQGDRPETPGQIARETLEGFGVVVDSYSKTGDDPRELAAELDAHLEAGVDYIFTVGGTGFGREDLAVDTVATWIETETPGIVEAMRAYGQARTPYAALSRSVAGLRGDTLVVTLPGSTRGLKESLDALFPWLLHVAKIFDKRG